MRNVMFTTALTAIAVTGLALPAAAEATNYVPCRSADGGSVVLRHKPRNCILGGQIHYQQAPLVKLRWRSWGGSSAYGRGRFIYNMGFNRAARIKLFRRRSWEERADVFRSARVCVRDSGCHVMRLPVH